MTTMLLNAYCFLSNIGYLVALKMQLVQYAIQKREGVYLSKDYPVTATWYPIRLPTGQYIHPFTIVTLQCLAYKKNNNIATKTIHLCLFQQKLHRPGVAIKVLKIYIFSDHVGRCT